MPLLSFKQFKMFKPFNPLLHPPPRRGGGKRWGLDLSEAVERNEVVERFEQFRITSDTPSLQYSMDLESFS
jgi:hypothetical protein